MSDIFRYFVKLFVQLCKLSNMQTVVLFIVQELERINMDSLQFVIKELGEQPNPRGGGGGGTARWDI